MVKVSPEKEKEVLELIKANQYRLSEIIHKSDITYSNFYQILKDNDIEFDKDVWKKSFKSRIQNLISEGKNITDICKEMDCTYSYLVNFINKNISFPRKDKYSDIKKYYEENPNFTNKQIGKHFKLTAERVRQILVNELKIVKSKTEFNEEKYRLMRLDIIDKIKNSNKTKKFIVKLQNKYSTNDRYHLKKIYNFTIQREFMKIRENYIFSLFNEKKLPVNEISKKLKIDKNRIKEILSKNVCNPVNKVYKNSGLTKNEMKERNHNLKKYYLEHKDHYTIQMIADHFHMSGERARQLLNELKIRKPSFTR